VQLDKRIRGAAAAGALLGLGALSTVYLLDDSPDVVHPQRVGDDTLVGYRILDDRTRVGHPMRLRLYFEDRPQAGSRPDVSLVHPSRVTTVDPVAAASRPDGSGGRQALELTIRPYAAPGSYKLRLGEGRPFGLLQVKP
jgi:hypothetical protein